MIKKGNLLRADRPLEPDKNPPFVPWGSNLIPHYLSTCGAPQKASNTNLVRSQNLSTVNNSSDTALKSNEETVFSKPLELEVVTNSPSELGNSEELNRVEFSKTLDQIDTGHLSEVTDFNNSWIRWKGFLKALKRKVFDNPSDNIGKLNTWKELFYSKALLYALTMNENSQKEIRKYSSASFNQLLSHNNSLFEAFSGSSMILRKQVYQFLQNILICLCVYEVIEIHSNVLKLEGSAAAGLCPDKKDFITKHVKQGWSELFSEENNEIVEFTNFLIKEIPEDFIESVKFNREQLLVKFNLKLHSRENRFIIQGSTDRLDNLQVSKIN